MTGLRCRSDSLDPAGDGGGSDATTGVDVVDGVDAAADGPAERGAGLTTGSAAVTRSVTRKLGSWRGRSRSTAVGRPFAVVDESVMST